MKDPGVQVQHAIELVFARFAAFGSTGQVVRSLRAENILLPQRLAAGVRAGQLLRQRPNQSSVYEILSNPAYAGMFVYGRPSPVAGSREQRQRGRDGWPAIHHGMYPAYISWEQYLSNQTTRISCSIRDHGRQARTDPPDRYLDGKPWSRSLHLRLPKPELSACPLLPAGRHADHDSRV